MAVGCAAKHSDDEKLGTADSLLVDDGTEAHETEDTMESVVEEPLTGADPTDPRTPAEAGDQQSLLGKIKTNPGRWFQPAGCVVTELTGNIAKHTRSRAAKAPTTSSTSTAPSP